MRTNNILEKKNSIRIFGLPGRQGAKDSRNIVVNFVNTKLNLAQPISSNDIEVCHRVGVKSPKNTQPMLCKFMRITDKMRVLKFRKELVRSGTSIFDDVAKRHLEYMDELKARKDIAQVWFYDGKIFCKPLGSDNICVPRVHCDIVKLLNETRAKPARKR